MPSVLPFNTQDVALGMEPSRLRRTVSSTISHALLAVAFLWLTACFGEPRPVRRAEADPEESRPRPPIPDVEDRVEPSEVPSRARDGVEEGGEERSGDPLLDWAPPYEGTAGIVDVPSPGGRVATLVGVETGRHPTFDRIVFTFAGEVLPGYHLEYVDRPVRRCGSGQTVELHGEGWLEVRLEPAAAHDEDGRPTVGDRRLEPALTVVLEAVLTCDFEAVVTWVLAVQSPNRYRVLELEDPARLVIDVRHE